MKKIALLMLLTLAAPAFADELAPRYLAISWFRDGGKIAKAGVIGCGNPSDCYPWSLNGLGADLFIVGDTGTAKSGGNLFGGLWVGQDFGLAHIAGDAIHFGGTTVGAVGGFDWGTLYYFLGIGYGVTYAHLDTERFGLERKTNAGLALITGVGFSPFPLAELARLGFVFQFKFSPRLPPIEERQEAVSRGYEPDLSALAGIMFRF